MFVEETVEKLIRAVDQIVLADVTPPSRAEKHIKMRIEFERILDQCSGPKHAMILEAILRTIDPLIKDEKVIKQLRDGNWNIYGSEHGEEPHGRFVAVYEVFVNPEDIEDGRCPPGPTFTLEAWMHDDKKKALKKYIELAKLHDSHSREYLLDLGDYPGDPTESTSIMQVEVKYAIRGEKEDRKEEEQNR